MDELQRATAHAEAEIIIALRALQARWECSVRVNITHGPLAQRSGDDGPNNVCGVEIRLLKHSMDGIDRSELEDDVQRTREAIIAQVEALE
ncbi:MAG: hypothetical protein HOH74_27225, partial [Gemmatimonadetes bacterium]|nr:hypothetical protein [Gemmatimonadota bacterium]